MSYKLNDLEKQLLAKGLNFALPPKILNRADYLLPFEIVYRDIKSMGVSQVIIIIIIIIITTTTLLLEQDLDYWIYSITESRDLLE